MTYEQPVEFLLKDLPERKSLIDHHEIGTNLLTWENAPANANRRDPDIVFLGEAKERATFAGMLELGNIGKACYVSLHTSRPRMVLPRILDKFPYDERAQAASILISNLRVIISQKLLLHANGKKRVAIREFVVFTAEDREAMLKIPIEEIPLYIDKISESERNKFHGCSPKRAGSRKYNRENIFGIGKGIQLMAERQQGALVGYSNLSKVFNI